MAEILNRQGLEYTGKLQPKPGERGIKGQILYPYLPNPELVEAVNLAIYLERPLLLKGEPGCGKTQLGSALAYELGLPFETWYVKSTSRAQDGLYNYDAVGRLRDAQLASSGRLTPEQLIGVSVVTPTILVSTNILGVLRPNLSTSLPNSDCLQSRGDICIGENSLRVSMVQQRLQQLGFFRGYITGYFGAATRDAVLQFQRDYQLNPKGIVDFQTWQALNNNNNPPIGNNPENRYVVVVPITDRDTLNRVRKFIPTAFSAQSRLGDYVNAGTYRERADAENISRKLRNQGLDARVEYF